MSQRPVCLITGASAGIGATTARLAAARGYDVMVGYNSDRAGAEAVAADVEKAGGRAAIQQGDVSTPEGIAALFDTLDAEFGRLNALVNNAGIVGQTAPVTEFDHARVAAIFNTNVVGAILVAKEAVMRMKAQNSGGVIVNIGSAAARLGSANQYVDYAASKAAIDTFTKGLSDEVSADGIRVMSVRPGLIETDLHAKGGEPGRADRLAHMVPMKRKGEPEEIAEAILWLMSDQAGYVTGSTLDVTGGR